ncbi:MAG: DUF4395 domain-containing protein, partial [Actinomycetes bacterium]
PLTFGFLARVLTGPRLSPLGQIATKWVAPRLPQFEKLVPGPPKRFAQGIGVGFTVTASALWLSGAHGPAKVVLTMLIAAATLEAAFGFCCGCKVFSLLIRAGLVPQSVCEECNDITRRLEVGTSV